MKREHPIHWTFETAPSDYQEAVERMDSHVLQMRKNQAPEWVWITSHPSLYTAGTSATIGEKKGSLPFPLYEVGRGGRVTYHGPGQLVLYVMIDLARRDKDVRRYVHALQQWIIDTLRYFGIHAESHPDRVGVWVNTPEGEKKIAALGIRIRHWITFHGMALNVSPDLTHFSSIVPCGLSEFGVTSLQELLGKAPSSLRLRQILQQTWDQNDFLASRERDHPSSSTRMQ